MTMVMLGIHTTKTVYKQLMFFSVYDEHSVIR